MNKKECILEASRICEENDLIANQGFILGEISLVGENPTCYITVKFIQKGNKKCIEALKEYGWGTDEIYPHQGNNLKWGDKESFETFNVIVLKKSYV